MWLKTSYKEKLEYSGLTFPFSIILQENRSSGKVVDLHWHDWYQVIFMIEGEGTVGIGDQEYALYPNHIVILNREEDHSFSIAPTQSATYMVMMFHPDMIKSMGMSIVESKYIMSFFNDLKSRVYSFSEDIESSKRLKSIFYELYNEYKEKATGYELVIKGYMYQFIAMLMRCGFFKEGIYNSHELERLSSIFTYIERHYKEALDMQQVANHLNMSYSYFSKYFKQATGKTFKQYVDYLRISEAEKLLLSGLYNVTETARQVGFNDVSSFNRVFKRVKNYSPKEVRTKSVKK
jgi:AraC-like DNA-binding protein